ncbi:hypothetical protein ACFLUS_05675 [Chloroflexota bacterium]
MGITNRLIEGYHRLMGGKYNKAVKRKQFNLTIDEELILKVKMIAVLL